MNTSWTDTLSSFVSSFVSTAGVVAVVAALVGTVVGLLERTHRRTGGFSRAPFGADLESDRDIVRTLDELRATRGRDAEQLARPAERLTRPRPSVGPRHVIQHPGRTGHRAAA